ncbi:paired amphipathic helix protein Sin3-like 1 [Typha angustifolia]|uniref:paired amphipathic helix protein Sin3-like 1 n=1 Tax=Typha angustifolia TaxID=59011 RepID=UPI003C2F78AD
MAPRLRSASKKRPTKDDALAFLKTVKEAFKDEKEKFVKFMEILKNSWKLSIGFSEVVEGVKEILRGHDYLILEFNIFLPKEYQIRNAKEQEAADREEARKFWGSMKAMAASREAQSSAGGGASKKVTLRDATAFLTAVRKAFADEKEKYYEFLEIMTDFKNKRINNYVVHVRVKRLFTGLDDLIHGFNNFLPETTITVSDQFMAMRLVVKIKDRFRHDEDVYISFCDILSMHRRGEKNIDETFNMISELLQDHRDLIEEFKCFLPSRFR